MVAGGREDRPRVRARKGKVPRLPRGVLSTVPGHGDLEYSPLRRLALQGSTPRGGDKSICSSKRCYNSFWLLLSTRQGQEELRKHQRGSQGPSSHKSTALPGSLYLAREDTSSGLVSERGRGAGFLPGLSPVPGLSHFSERDKLTVVQRFRQIMQDSALWVYQINFSLHL